MKRKFIKKLNKEIVLKYYPDAVCERRTTGKQWYYIWNHNNMLGQGGTEGQAWRAAYHNL